MKLMNKAIKWDTTQRILIPIDVFGFDVQVIVGDNILNELKKIGIEGNDPDKDKTIRAYTTNSSPKATYADVFMLFDKTKVSLSDVHHEITHAVTIILSYIGINRSPQTDEVYAYLGDYLFREILKFLRSIIGIELLNRD